MFSVFLSNGYYRVRITLTFPNEVMISEYKKLKSVVDKVYYVY